MDQREQLLNLLGSTWDILLKETLTREQAKPRIAAWGLVKAGKSSLLNMLSGHVNDEFFKTGPVRTTRLNHEFEADNYILVDTPGLGIDDNDSKQAYEGLNKADIVLFIHALQGELDREEIDLLIQVKAAYGQETGRRLILILSQLDKDQDGAMATIHQQVMQQLHEFIGVKPQCFQVSSLRYQKGRTEHKPTLMQKSGIPVLAQHLDTLSLEIKDELDRIRLSRREARKNELLKKVEKAIEEELKHISVQQKTYIERVRSFNSIMAELKSGFSAHSAEIATVTKELDSI